jgi:hypothetical protein
VVPVAAEADEDEVEVDGDREVGLVLEAVEGREVARLYPVLRQRLVRALCGLLELFLAAGQESAGHVGYSGETVPPNLQAHDFLNREIGKANRVC